TSVKLFFPMANPADDGASARARASRSSVRQAVLLAEDDRDVRTTLARALREAGHRVVEVGDVEAGRVVVRERGAEFAVLVTDGIRPGGSTGHFSDASRWARP